jgi:hypothetical protein
LAALTPSGVFDLLKVRAGAAQGDMAMSSKLQGAVDELLAELDKQALEVAATKKTINVLLSRMGKEPMFPDENPEQVTGAKVRADQFYSRPLATSMQEILQQRKQATSMQDILQQLKDGGFDFKGQGWKEKDWLRMVAINLGKNTKVFHKLPNGTYGLLAWYPQVADRKAEKALVEEEGGDVPAEDKNKAPAA